MSAPPLRYRPDPPPPTEVGDQIDRTAQQVRGLARNEHAVHRLLATVRVPGSGGRAYRTACHRDLPTRKATLTTVGVDCLFCQAAS